MLNVMSIFINSAISGVLLTLVDVMWALDSRTHHEEIDHYLSQLQKLDPLRSKYYADMSK